MHTYVRGHETCVDISESQEQRANQFLVTSRLSDQPSQPRFRLSFSKIPPTPSAVFSCRLSLGSLGSYTGAQRVCSTRCSWTGGLSHQKDYCVVIENDCNIGCNEHCCRTFSCVYIEKQAEAKLCRQNTSALQSRVRGVCTRHVGLSSAPPPGCSPLYVHASCRRFCMRCCSSLGCC